MLPQQLTPVRGSTPHSLWRGLPSTAERQTPPSTLMSCRIQELSTPLEGGTVMSGRSELLERAGTAAGSWVSVCAFRLQKEAITWHSNSEEEACTVAIRRDVGQLTRLLQLRQRSAESMQVLWCPEVLHSGPSERCTAAERDVGCCRCSPVVSEVTHCLFRERKRGACEGANFAQRCLEALASDGAASNCSQHANELTNRRSSESAVKHRACGGRRRCQRLSRFCTTFAPFSLVAHKCVQPPSKIEQLYEATGGNNFAAINSPTAGARASRCTTPQSTTQLTGAVGSGPGPVPGAEDLQLYSLATPNGWKVAHARPYAAAEGGTAGGDLTRGAASPL